MATRFKFQESHKAILVREGYWLSHICLAGKVKRLKFIPKTWNKIIFGNVHVVVSYKLVLVVVQQQL